MLFYLLYVKTVLVFTSKVKQVERCYVYLSGSWTGVGKLRPLSFGTRIGELEEIIIIVSKSENSCISSIFSVF